MTGIEAQSRIKINKLLEEAGWRCFDNENGNRHSIRNETRSNTNGIFGFTTTPKANASQNQTSHFLFNALTDYNYEKVALTDVDFK
jgi:hypothetical protein